MGEEHSIPFVVLRYRICTPPLARTRRTGRVRTNCRSTQRALAARAYLFCMTHWAKAETSRDVASFTTSRQERAPLKLGPMDNSVRGAGLSAPCVRPHCCGMLAVGSAPCAKRAMFPPPPHPPSRTALPGTGRGGPLCLLHEESMPPARLTCIGIPCMARRQGDCRLHRTPY